MKASAFNYARATSVGNALQMLAAHGESAKVLSGGQSLLPAMNLRLIAPEMLVDIGGLPELKGITLRDNLLRIGALTRHVDLLYAPEIATHAPLLTEAIGHVAHPAIRNKGTLGGSLAHADPAAELPACMIALDANIVVRHQAGERRIAAENFFTGIYETALSAQELLVAVELPVARRHSLHFFHEFARRHGDYAIIGGAAQAVVQDGRFTKLRFAFFAVDDRPVLARATARLVDADVTRTVLLDVANALGDELQPQEDQQASAAMRRHLARVLLVRGVATLLGRPDLMIKPS